MDHSWKTYAITQAEYFKNALSYKQLSKLESDEIITIVLQHPVTEMLTIIQRFAHSTSNSHVIVHPDEISPPWD